MQITNFWNPASISAIAALGGSLVGALGSTVANSVGQRHHDRRDFLAKKIYHREQLYSDFISETARTLAHALQHRFQDPGTLIASYALLSRIRLSSPMNVVESAENVITTILGTYSQPNLTPEEIQAWAANKTNDPLRKFGDVCRRELDSLWKGL